MSAFWERLLEGDERFSGTDLRVRDFWRWALGDLVSNATRGILAQFLVAAAVGDESLYDPWSTVDVYDGEFRIQVKAGGRLQGWEQRGLSTPTWEGNLCSKHWHRQRDKRTSEYHPNADVWVFAIQTCEDHDEYNALNLDQWDFYVLPASNPLLAGRISHELEARKTGAILGKFKLSLWQIEGQSSRLRYPDLADAIRAAERAIH